MKKKIFAIALAVMLFALSIVGSSVAYFTDVEKATNTFTVGDVNITLTYAGEVADEDTSRAVAITKQNVYPGQEIPVNATITNVGTEMAYVGAIITLTNVDATLINPTGNDNNMDVAVSEFITGLADGANVKYVANGTTLTIYVLKTAPIAKTKISKVCENIVIPTTWDNDQMDMFNTLELEVKAYAVQVQGFNTDGKTAADAFSAAFGASNTDAWYPYFN